jgi:NitT/TauT family transport system permease protein
MAQEKWMTSVWSFAVLVVFLLTWEYVPGWLGVPQFVLPPFSQVTLEAVRIWDTERLMWHAGITAAEVVIGFIVGSALGAMIGYALGISPRIEAILSPYLLALQIAPKVAFVFFPVLINVLSAMRAMDGDLINLARSFSATRFQVFRMVEFPTTLPPLFSGLRIASTLAVIGVVVGELVGGNMGLGYLLVFFEGQGNTAGVFVIIGALTVIGILAYYAVVLAEKRVLHYLLNTQRQGA